MPTMAEDVHKLSNLRQCVQLYQSITNCGHNITISDQFYKSVSELAMFG